MPDLMLTDSGDISVAGNGDIEMVPNLYQNYSQQAYLRMMTEQGDFTLYPQLGASLETLIGMPNTAKTGELGRELVLNALEREGAFTGLVTDVKAVPVSHDAIRFDVYITAGSRTEMVLSIEQSLTPLMLEDGLLLVEDE